MTVRKIHPELDEDDSDADHLPQLDEKPAPKKATTYGAGDLAKLLNVEPRVARQRLRQLAKTDQSPLLRVRDSGGYQWTKRELDAVAKKLAKSES